MVGQRTDRSTYPRFFVATLRTRARNHEAWQIFTAIFVRDRRAVSRLAAGYRRDSTAMI